MLKSINILREGKNFIVFDSETCGIIGTIVVMQNEILFYPGGRSQPINKNQLHEISLFMNAKCNLLRFEEYKKMFYNIKKYMENT